MRLLERADFENGRGLWPLASDQIVAELFDVVPTATIAGRRYGLTGAGYSPPHAQGGHGEELHSEAAVWHGSPHGAKVSLADLRAWILRELGEGDQA